MFNRFISRSGFGLLVLVGTLSLSAACTREDVAPRGHRGGCNGGGTTTTTTTTTTTDTTTTSTRVGG